MSVLAVVPGARINRQNSTDCCYFIRCVCSCMKNGGVRNLFIKEGMKDLVKTSDLNLKIMSEVRTGILFWCIFAAWPGSDSVYQNKEVPYATSPLFTPRRPLSAHTCTHRWDSRGKKWNAPEISSFPSLLSNHFSSSWTKELWVRNENEKRNAFIVTSKLRIFKQKEVRGEICCGEWCAGTGRERLRSG